MGCSALLKYLQGTSFFGHTIPRAASQVWRRIVSARKALLKGVCFQLGSGDYINPFTGPWVCNIEGFILKPKEEVDIVGIKFPSSKTERLMTRM